MKLEELRICRAHRGFREDREEWLEGTVDFVGSSGAIKIKLTDEQLAGVMGVVGDALVAQCKDVARNLSTEALNTALSLASPVSEGRKDE